MNEACSIPLNEKIFTYAFEYAAMGTALVDPHGRWLFVNAALCEFFGYSKAELLSFSIQDIAHPEDSESVKQCFDDLISGRKKYCRREKRYIHKEQHVVHAMLNVSLVRNDDVLPFFIVQLQDITERKKLEDELERQAMEDALTGICNRRCFYERSSREIIRTARYGEPAVFLMLDIDHFKRVNDTFGHAGGDEALKELTTTVENLLRPFDIFGRVGGEEFAILLVQTTAGTGSHVAERLRMAVEKIRITTLQGDLRFTISIGGVAFSGNDHCLDGLLHYADEMLYEAKSSGRNRVRMLEHRSCSSGLQSDETFGFLHLKWHPHYECGHVLLDQQHRKLFELANAILDQVGSSPDFARMQILIEQFLVHVTDHFRFEEAILQSLSYPFLNTHRQVHTDLLEKAQALVQKYFGKRLEFADVLRFLVVEVVYEHLLHDDKKFFPHIVQ